METGASFYKGNLKNIDMRLKTNRVHGLKSEFNDEYFSVDNKDSDFVSIPHFHTYNEIFYNISGAEGFFANSEFYKCREHELVIIPALTIHKIVVPKNVLYKRCIMQISDYAIDYTKLLCQQDTDSDILKFNKSKTPFATILSEEEHSKFINLAKKYKDSENKSDYFHSLALFMETLSFCVKKFKKSDTLEMLDDNHISDTNKVMRLVEKNYRTISVADVSGELYLSRDYIGRVFKNDTGRTIKEYIIMRKIAEARKQLFMGKGTKEACFLSGFGNYSNFFRCFRQIEGCTPKEFVSTYRNERF